MGKVAAQKTDQAASNREQILEAAVVGGIGIEAQLPAIRFPPLRVEIEDNGDQPVLGALKLVQVPAVVGPGGIEGQVALELEQAQKEGAVDGQAQFLQEPQVVALGGGGRFRVQPLDVVAPDRAVGLELLAAADAGRAQPATVPQRPPLAGQLLDQFRGQEVVADDQPGFRQLEGDVGEIVRRDARQGGVQHHGKTRIPSISTAAPLGSAATPTAARAG